MSATHYPKGERPTLADVDGTKPGVASLVMMDLRKGQDATPMTQTIVEDENTPNPHEVAEGLYQSIADDWPGWTYTILVDDRARYLMATGRMRRMGFDGETPEEFLEGLHR